MLAEGLYRWDLNCEDAVGSLTCFAAVELMIHEVHDLLTMAVRFKSRCTITGVSALVAANKLELEVLDVFIALGVVGDDTNLDLLTQIVLVLVKENL